MENNLKYPLISFLILVILMVAQPSYGALTRRYVTQAGAGSKDGTSWANAYDKTQLQTAINETSVSEVWVAAGTYTPVLEVGGTGTLFQAFQMKDNCAIYGGFAGTESTLANRDIAANVTILSGDLNGDDGSNFTNRSDNCYHVFKHPSGFTLTNTGVLDGFTIRGGNAVLSANSDYYGGGMYNNGCSPTINNCIFTDNYASYGGGGYFSGSLSNTTFTNCLFYNNKAGVQGGAMQLTSSTNIITNCTIVGNIAPIGGGLFLRWYSNVTTINNSIIWGNTATTSNQGNQIYRDANITSVTLNYSCYSNATGDIAGTDGMFTATNNDLTLDPMFANSAGYDYRILGISPCADAGLDSYNLLTTDIRGSSSYGRFLNKTDGTTGTIDMGAYEYKCSVDPLPVELTSFTASINNNAVALRWNTATEVNNYGFDIERRMVKSEQSMVNSWTKIGFVSGNGTSSVQHSYSYADNSASFGTYAYRLKQIDNDGMFKYSQESEVSLSPKTSALRQNYPNPFNPTTQISYDVATVGSVRLAVYDILGREVAVLVNEQQAPGSYTAQFNASQLSSGIYFFKLTTNQFSSIRKMTLMK